jgi:alkanesulfonate monooxygenase SsuD/methylene tetrahydromethanopterin reductase-like flavin-dependent oxidoreductase (luciferase family)
MGDTNFLGLFEFGRDAAGVRPGVLIGVCIIADDSTDEGFEFDSFMYG